VFTGSGTTYQRLDTADLSNLYNGPAGGSYNCGVLVINNFIYVMSNNTGSIRQYHKETNVIFRTILPAETGLETYTGCDLVSDGENIYACCNTRIGIYSMAMSPILYRVQDVSANESFQQCYFRNGKAFFPMDYGGTIAQFHVYG
jgi:hypothetical protein